MRVTHGYYPTEDVRRPALRRFILRVSSAMHENGVTFDPPRKPTPVDCVYGVCMEHPALGELLDADDALLDNPLDPRVQIYDSIIRVAVDKVTIAAIARGRPVFNLDFYIAEHSPCCWAFTMMY